MQRAVVGVLILSMLAEPNRLHAVRTALGIAATCLALRPALRAGAQRACLAYIRRRRNDRMVRRFTCRDTLQNRGKTGYPRRHQALCRGVRSAAVSPGRGCGGAFPA